VENGACEENIMDCWEYQVTEKPRAGMVVEDPTVEMWTKHLNEQGAKGWELVGSDRDYFLWKKPRDAPRMRP
jgi:hypothetical protein